MKEAEMIYIGLDRMQDHNRMGNDLENLMTRICKHKINGISKDN